MSPLEALRDAIETAQRNDATVTLQLEDAKALLATLDAAKPWLHRMSDGRVSLNGPILGIEESAVVHRALGEEDQL